jgi:hypothetical protein
MPVPGVGDPALSDPPLNGLGINADLLRRFGWRDAFGEQRIAQTVVRHPEPPGIEDN